MASKEVLVGWAIIKKRENGKKTLRAVRLMDSEIMEISADERVDWFIAPNNHLYIKSKVEV